MDIRLALAFLKKTVENTAVAAVKTLKAHTFKVDIGEKAFKVTNFPKTQDIRGRVTVENQKQVEQLLTKLFKRQVELGQQLQEEMKKLKPLETVKVGNLSDLPQYPTSVSLKNPQKTVSVTNFYEVVKELGKLQKLVDSLPKSYPEVKIPPYPKMPAFPDIRIPEPLKAVGISNFEELVDLLRSADPKDYVPVRLSDGDKFYEALESLSVGTSSGYSYQRGDGLKVRALVNDYGHVMTGEAYGMNDEATVGSTTYTGNQDGDGNWFIMRVISSAGGTQMRYASKANNPNVANYSDAWGAKTGLTYGTYAQAF